MRRAIWALALLPTAATAQRATLHADERLTVEVHGDNRNRQTDDDDYGVVIQRLTLTGSAGEMTTRAEVDGELFVSPPGDAYQDDARLSRITVEYAPGDWKLQLGDFHRQLGRGIILSLRKIDELGQDLTLQGGRVERDGDDHQADLFAGRTNASELDPVSQKHLEDPSDVIAGGAYTYRGLQVVTLGVHGLHLRPRRDLLAGDEDHTSAAGVSLETPALGDVLALYVEADWEGRHTAGQGAQGRAAYATVDLRLGDFSAVAEGLLLDDFFVRGSPNTVLSSAFDYAQPPTLERIDQEVLENTDTRGARLQLSYALGGGDLVPYVNGMYRQNQPGTTAQLDQVHSYAGFEWLYQGGVSRLSASGGWRREAQDGDRLKGMVHGEADWLQALGGAYALHLTVNHESRTLADRDYLRGTSLLGVEHGGLGSATVEVGYDTQDPSDDVRHLFVAGHLTWDTLEWLALRATGGSQRGGLKCVAGICRDFPAFTGGRLEAIVRHELM